MKKVIAKIMLLVMIMQCLAVPVLAGDGGKVNVHLTSPEGDMQIKLQLPDESIGKHVFVYILNPGYQLTDMAYENFEKNIKVFQYAGQQEYSGGTLTMDFRMNTSQLSETAGNVYKIAAEVMNSSVKLSGEFTYLNKSERERLTEMINGSEITEDMVQQIYDGFSMQFLDMFQNIPAELIAQKLMSVMEEQGQAEQKDVIECMTEAVIWAGTEHGAVSCEDLAEYNNVIGFSDDFYAYSDLNENGKNLMLNNLKESKCDNPEEWKNSMKQAMLSALIYGNKTEGNGIVDIIIEKYKDYFTENGLDISAYESSKKDVVGKNLIQEGEKNYADMVQTINTLAEKNKKEINNGGGSSGGSGAAGGSGSGGKSSSSGSGAMFPAVDVQIVEKAVFSDLDKAEWARESIERLAGLNIVKGKEDGIFAPMDYVTREEFVKMITGAFNIPLKQTNVQFRDVSNERWSYNAIQSASACGIVFGYDGVFNPQALITREDMAVMLIRTLRYKNRFLPMESNDCGFYDADMISDYAVESVAALYQNGLISGMGNNCFEAKKSATRAEAAAMICNIMDYEGGELN